VRRAALSLVVAAACTSSGGDAAPTQPSPLPGPTASPTGTALPVIAGPGEPAVDGMQLAAERVGVALQVIDAAGDPTGSLRSVLEDEPAAVFAMNMAQAVAAARPEIEAAGVPVVVVGGDLYSQRALFRYAFQVSAPLTWQARVLAHYLVTDRGYERIALVGSQRIAEAALAEEGVSPVDDPGGAQAVLALERAESIGMDQAQLALAADALGFSEAVPPGTVTCAAYTWAGWAEPIPRVGGFRERFARRFGREPGLSEQEGYDAVMSVAEALRRTGGRGGDALVRQLETFRDETYSSTPIRLGPDDHVFAEQSHLGLFAVAGPDEEPNPPEAMGALPWRPLMRTFTTNGKRVNLADRDVRVFFPHWGPRRPRPNYWRSEYGIVTRPDDPLH
jgi:ABC-type branched-subunit amino acid transport system substrate-binding protein